MYMFLIFVSCRTILVNIYQSIGILTKEKRKYCDICDSAETYGDYTDLAYPELFYPGLTYPDLAYQNLAYPDLVYLDLAYPSLACPGLAYPDLVYPNSRLSGPRLFGCRLSGPHFFSGPVTYSDQSVVKYLTNDRS